jgi:hypothetical protein
MKSVFKVKFLEIDRIELPVYTSRSGKKDQETENCYFVLHISGDKLTDKSKSILRGLIIPGGLSSLENTW